MAMTAELRAQAIFTVIRQANPRVGEMTTGERMLLQNNLKTIFGGDLAYIQSAAEIPGAQYQAPATSCTVATATGPASGSTVPATVVGIGKVF